MKYEVVFPSLTPACYNKSSSSKTIRRDIMGTAIAEYSVTTAELGKLKKKFVGVKYEVATTAGMDTARKDRRELVTLRTDLEKKRVEIKAPALERCKQIDAEAKRITAEIEALEKPIDDIIKAEEARREEIRKEKERLAAEAQKVLDDKILLIAKLPLTCSGKSAAEVALFLATIEGREIGGEFTGETRVRAEQAKAEAVAEIKIIHAALIDAEERAAAEQAEREAEAIRQAELKKENDRILAEQKAEFQRREAEFAEQKRIQDEKDAAFRAEQEAFRKEQAKIAEAKAAEERAEQEKKDAILAEERKQEELKAEAKRIQDAKDKADAERKEVEAEKERKAAEKALKLANAKCKSAGDALKKILAICNDTEVEALVRIDSIRDLSEANI